MLRLKACWIFGVETHSSRSCTVKIQCPWIEISGVGTGLGTTVGAGAGVGAGIASVQPLSVNVPLVLHVSGCCGRRV